MKLDSKDYIITTFSSGKKGSWSMGSDKGVRIYHKPTEITVECDNYKSVHKNKDECIRLIEEEICWRNEDER